MTGLNRWEQVVIDCDETFSPVVKPATIRVILSIVVSKKWLIHQLDVKNAFLHSNLAETAPRAGYQQFGQFVSTIGFSHSLSDNSLFIHRCGINIAYILLYVYDIILATSSDTLWDTIIGNQQSEFSMTNLGQLNYFLGISAMRHDHGVLFLHQKKYAEEIIFHAKMTNYKPALTPVDTKSKLGVESSDKVVDPTLYRSLDGALQYLTFITRQNFVCVSKPRKRPYRIDNWCLSLPEVRHMVSSVWDTPYFGSSMYVLSRKLAAVRRAIMQWVIHHRISNGINWSSIEADLDSTAAQIVDEHSANSFLQLRSTRLQLLHDQRQYWVQRSKIKSEVLDGFPTRFLFSRVKQRATKHRILALRTVDGVSLDTPADITSEITSYFQVLLCRQHTSTSDIQSDLVHHFLSDLDLPSLGPVECSLLQAPFLEHDVLRAIQGMDASKSPGPDGITPKFFQTFWPQIGDLVTSAILRFLNSGVMLKEWNNTSIVLIPKIEKPELVSQFRPISLCNVIYRLASKCMANRLKLVIPSLISDSQQAFVPGNLMSDGCVMAHEIMHYLNKTKHGTNCYSVLKLDMHKAFDRVSWQFLMSILERFGFPITWRNLIWECISTVTYSILVNGEPSPPFYPSCGLRQGDPLSPYLFIMCMEILSCQLRKAESQKQLLGLKISRYAPPLSHLFYADDAFICCKATPGSFEALRDIFRLFEAVSGQMINLDKSFIKFSPNSPDDFKTHMTAILRMKESSSFGTYLGVPVDLPKRKTTAFHEIIDKVNTRISSWSSLHLSQASKFVIINSILFGSLMHILAAVPLPLSTSRKLDSLIAAFWWNKNTAHRSIHWLSQQHLHSPKETGGLGIKSVTTLGQSSLMKNFWRIHHKPMGLLARYLGPKYRKDLPVPGLKSKVSQPSFVWHGICRTVASCTDAIAWKVGNGKSFNLFSSPWVQGETPVLRQEQRQEQPHIAPNISSLVQDNGSWNPHIIFRLFNFSTAKNILAMEPPVLDSDDFLYWKYTEDGSFTIRSGYKYLLSQRPSPPPLLSSFPWKLVWRFPFSSKFPLLVWRLAHGILPTRTVLAHRGFNLDRLCPLCQCVPETPEHLFRSCDITQHIWRSSTLGICSLANPTVSFIQWLADHISYLHRVSKTEFNSLLYFFCILRSIWLTRNSIVFENSPVHPARFLQLAETLHSFHSRLPSLRHEDHQLRLPSVLEGTNCSLPAPSISYYLCICRIYIHNGYMITVSTSASDNCDRFYVRAPSTLAAYSQALLQLMQRLHLESSSFITFWVTSRKLSSVLAPQQPVPIDARNSLLGIRLLLRLHRSWSVSLATG
ncbi:uncharacterized protein LOC141601961 [Silene latifolia]|uniref:uncharacterized protein LOC141601961 n=1 Tax=Silene latifolia TaxID=37657 RepID=UPI003D779831